MATVEEIDQLFKKTLKLAMVDVRMFYYEDIRQAFFFEFENFLNLQTRGRRDFYCTHCVRLRYCPRGMAQFLACVAHFKYANADEETQKFYQEYPIIDKELAKLDREQLLGVFYFQKYNLRTVVDFSRRGLRLRLLEIVENNSPYLLTT